MPATLPTSPPVHVGMSHAEKLAYIADYANILAQGATALSVSGTATAQASRWHRAVAPVTLTIPPAGAGFEGHLEHGTYGTVGLAFPTGWTIDYVGLAPGAEGRPYVTGHGGVISFKIISPGRIRISGDYMTGAWLPMDAGANFLGMWKAGYGHIGGAIGATSETVPPLTTQSLVWAPLFSPVAERRFAYPAVLNSSMEDYCPILEADATAASKSSYLARSGSTTSRVYNANFLMQTGACHFFLALRQHATGQNGTTVLRLSTANAPAGYGSLAGGLIWQGSTYRYQVPAANSTGSWGTKSGTAGVHEDTTAAVSLSVVIGAGGGGTIYSGTQQVSGPVTASGALAINQISLYTGLNSNILGCAFFNGAPANLAAAQAWFAAQYIA